MERAGSGRTRRVLLVDEDAGVRAVVARHLRARGLEVSEAEKAEDALAADGLPEGEMRPYDLVLADVRLPGLSGVELARFLLTRSPLQAVVLIAGDGEEGLVREALTYGVVGHLVKPFDLAELDAAVGRALARLELAEAAEALLRTAPAAGAAEGEAACILPAAWLRLADERSGAGRGHGERVAQVAGMLAAVLAGEPSARERRALDLAARTHELGRLLGRPTGLADLGARTAHLLEMAGIGEEVVGTVRALAERWDGTGGPEGLRGPDIPRTALVLAAADAFDHYASAQEAAGLEREDAVQAALVMLTSHAEASYGPCIARALRDAKDALTALWLLHPSRRQAPPALTPAS